MSDERLEIFKAVIPDIRHNKTLGLEVVDMQKGSVELKLPYSDEIVGNPETGVISGGALTTLMDNACGFAAISALEDAAIAPTLDLRIDYMRAAKPGEAVFGYAEVYRTTRNVLFARGIAYQGDRDKPVAHCSATFMCLDKDAIESNKEKS